MRWRYILPDRVRDAVDDIEDPVLRGHVADHMKALASDPYRSPHGQPVRRGQRGVRKVYRIAVGDWRIVYTITPTLREVYVNDVVLKVDELYTVRRVRRWLRAARLRRLNPSLDRRIRLLLGRHSNWSDATVAKAVGASTATVRRRRQEWGIPARHSLPWRPWERRKCSP